MDGDSNVYGLRATAIGDAGVADLEAGIVPHAYWVNDGMMVNWSHADTDETVDV